METCALRIDTNLWLKRVMPRAGVAIGPKAGHLLKREDPQRVNAEAATEGEQVKADNWPEGNELRAGHAAPDTAIF